MSEVSSTTGSNDAAILRQRANAATAAAAASDSQSSTPTPTETNSKSTQDDKSKEENVMGRTPDGTVFKVPHTPDMLTSIFHPRQPKTPLDLLTIASLSLQLAIYFFTSRTFSQIFFFFYFAIWRASYNAGLGYILKQQSERGWIVKEVKRNGWFDEKKQPKVREWIKQQLVTKMDKDYNFEEMPIDYNIWLMFRSIVDVILLNDFVAYSLFAFSCTRLPAGHSLFLHVLRWVVGWGLIFFNLWVKMDAHRVVKDYAWYWGDCFFLCLQSLVFDGVYEIAPDPMYSIGYAGYYGLSLVSGSYAVLFVSLAAHASQFLFLQWFENPHIERTYGERKPLAARVPLRTAPYNKASAQEAAGTKVFEDDSEVPSPKSPSLPELRTPSQTDGSSAPSDDDEALDGVSSTPLGDINGIRSRNSGAKAKPSQGNPVRPRSESRSWDSEPQHVTNLHDLHHLLFRKDTVVFKNLDLLRGNDFLLVVAVFYAFIPLILPSSLGPKSTLTLLYANALGWRLIHSLGLGYILSKQSSSKWMVRHFIKHYNYEHSSEAVLEAFANWKVIYNTSLVMTYLSFGTLCLKCYAPLGRDWTVGTDLLRHVLGGLLIALHIWTANSSYKVLGPFGWLYGDFFIDDYPHQLFYTGIYRFLNNPERSMGGAAFFGLVLISGSKLVTTLAIVSQVAHWIFLSTVEGPHMRKLYGEAALNRDGGVTKQLKNVAERNSYLFKAAQSHPKVKEMQENFEQMQKNTTVALEEFVNKQKPKFNGIVEDTKSLIQQAGNRLLIVKKGGNLDTIDRSQYEVSVNAPSTSTSAPAKIPRFHLGEPIPVSWKASSSHSRRDWIGIYLLTRFGPNQNSADEQGLITEISSQGKWIGVAENEWDGDVHTGPRTPSGSEQKEESSDKTVTGVSVLKSKKLPWVTGLYEIRYHHDAKHNVLTRSGPIEIYVDTPSNPDSFEETYSSLAKIVTLSLDSDESLAPRSQTGRPKASTAEETPKGLNSDEDPDDFTIWDKNQASRISSAIKMAYGVEFSTEVVVASANVRKLARDVVEARQLLEGGFRPNLVEQ